jgi:hypothetical protein
MNTEEVRVQDIAQRWFHWAVTGEVNARDPFFQFIAVWVAFNALYSWAYGPSGPEGWRERLRAIRRRDNDRNPDRRKVFEREKVQLFSTEKPAIQAHRELMGVDHSYREAVEYLERKPPTNPENPNRSPRISAPDDLEQVLLCVYQVRNNLFHGGKMPRSGRDERLVQVSFTVISKLLKPYFARETFQWLG